MMACASFAVVWAALAVCAFSTAAASTYVQLNGLDATNMPILNPVGLGSPLDGLDFPGNDIQMYSSVSSVEDCASMCQHTEGCGGYVYHDSTCPGVEALQCWTKSSLPAGDADVTKPCCHAGAVSSDPMPYLFDAPHMKALCEATSGCVAFSTGDGFLRSFASNSSVISFLSNATCGLGIATEVQGGSPFAPQGEFTLCTVQGSFPYVATVAYNLPPFLLQQACDQSKTCVGFLAMTDISQGWLLSWSPATAAADVALFSSNLPSV